MRKQFLLRGLLVFVISLIGAMVTTAQSNTPAEINAALEALEQRAGQQLTLDDLSSFEWEARTFDSAALGCPTPDAVYAQVLTDGYRFLLSYDGNTYDYRVAQNSGNVVLCDVFSSDNNQPANQPAPCGNEATVVEGDTLVEIADRCNTSVNALVAANEGLNSPQDTIFPGTVLVIPNRNPDDNQTDISNGTITIWPLAGQPGTELTVTLNGFPANEAVELGLGRPNSEYDILQTERTNGYGGLQTSLTIYENSDLDEAWVVVAKLPGSTDELISATFYSGNNTNETLFNQVNIFMIDTNTGGQIGCGDTVRAVNVAVEPTIAPLSAAYEQLLAIDEGTYQGFDNALAESTLVLDSASIENQTATVQINGELRIGGTCDVPRIEAQLQQTALQYSTVTAVSIFINGQPLADVLSAQG